MKQSTILIFLAIVSSGCAWAQAIPTGTSLPPAVIQIASPIPSQIPSTETKKPVEQENQRTPTQYDLDVLFDYSEHNLKVREKITYTNNSNDPLTELQLVVDAFRSGASFSFSDLRAIDETEIGEYELSEGILHIPLLNSLNSREAIQIEIRYELVLPAGAGTLSWTDRQANLIDWYPYLPPYIEGQGWLVHTPAAVGEYSVFESSNFNVHLEIVNAPASLQIAAPAPVNTSMTPAVLGGTTFDYVLYNARRFIWSASGQYEVLDTQFEDIPISIYYFNEHRDAAEASLETARQALEIYSELYSPFPYESLAIVDAQFYDGLESDGIFFLDQSYFLQYNYSPRNYLTTLTAHEVAHNWWFGQTGNDQALEPWLDEALCIYSELLYYDDAYPEMTDWWWQFRIDRFRPVGLVNSSIYNHSSFDSYVQAVYMRGAQFLQNLRNAVGDSAFFAFLRGYSADGAGKIFVADDFFNYIRDYSSVNLDLIKAEFFSSQ